MSQVRSLGSTRAVDEFRDHHQMNPVSGTLGCAGIARFRRFAISDIEGEFIQCRGGPVHVMLLLNYLF